MINNRLLLLLSAGAGAVAMYYLDPARGRYRRALVRDRLVHSGHKARHGVGVIGRDMRNRTIGTAATMRSLLDFSEADDAVLSERVRACLGRVVSHPASIEVAASDGVITLSGPVLEAEVPALIDCVLGVRGVKDLRNLLEIHSEPGHVPGLQGQPRPRPGRRSAFLQSNWSPTVRALGALAGAAATVYGAGNRNPLARTLLGATGLMLLARAATNLELARMFGIGVPRRAVDVQKTLRIHAPVETVFKLWDDAEQFPHFMTHVRRVRRLQDARRERDRWRWTVRAAGGLEFEFDAEVTAREENRLIAWRTEEGALIQHAGRVLFQDNGDGTTTVDVRMTYNPVAGAVGHAFAWMLGADPKHQLDDDLMRMKTLLETGRPPRDAADPRSDFSVEPSGVEGEAGEHAGQQPTTH